MCDIAGLERCSWQILPVVIPVHHPMRVPTAAKSSTVSYCAEISGRKLVEVVKNILGLGLGLP